ncbi:hypothetical protein KO481_11620 [Nocardia sp. NEAU-G5]|uniref:Uncharacterized protein n=1 Tax=Nocardia albiluteola TaxID=2842303 RepID=A0ABS6AY90_9NOCA|nr:hypothetical protein [Nocardia albiluteola]MBU3062171.1 hypothetical protein [Nocardia albiluteola]
MTVVRSALRRVGAGRLLVVAAVLLGMFLLQNAHCAADGGGPTVPAVRILINSDGDCVAMSHIGDDATPVPAPGEGNVAAVAMVSHGGGDRTHPAGQVTMACLAVFLALLTAVAMLSPIRSMPRVRPCGPVNVRRPTCVLPRALTLSQLCVLRT